MESRQLDPAKPVVAFDFDGTLTCADCFTAFLLFDAGALVWAGRLLALAPDLLSYLLNRDRARLKAAAARLALGGRALGEVEARAGRFAAAVRISASKQSPALKCSATPSVCASRFSSMSLMP